MCSDMCEDMRFDMCVAMPADMCADMCEDMRFDMCADMPTGMRGDICVLDLDCLQSLVGWGMEPNANQHLLPKNLALDANGDERRDDGDGVACNQRGGHRFPMGAETGSPSRQFAGPTHILSTMSPAL